MRGVLSAPKRSSLSSKATVRDSSTSLGMTNNPFATAGDGGYSRSREASTSLGMTSIGRDMNARLLLLLFTATLPTFAQQTPQQSADAELPSLLTIYTDIHTHPELSTQEQRTAALLEKELKEVGCDVTENVGKYDKPDQKCFGVVGLMKNGDGSVVLVRTDLDALPVQEETGLPYASTVVTKNEKGDDVHVMHACGHDAHISMIIGVARALAKLKDQWQTIASRENNPIDPIVITVGSIHGGTKHNIIPDEVKMQLTVRTYKADVRERVLAAIERIAKGCATAAGLPSDKMPTMNVLRDQFTPATYNNPELTKRLVPVWKKALGDQNVEMAEPTMGGEDFSEFSLLPEHSIPAVDFHAGAVDPAKIAESKKPGASPLPSLHSSKFAPVPEPTIRTGMVAMTAAVLDLMKK